MNRRQVEKNKPSIKAYSSGDIAAVRIYLEFSKSKSIITIQQLSKELSDNIFLKRSIRIRKPYIKRMRIGIGGSIQTTQRAYRKIFKKNITHIGIYTSNPLAVELINEIIKPLYLSRKNIKIILISEEDKDLLKDK
ncbi:hypothetical protein TSL6_20430 [Sulfurovum sp. TSL6]|uniref:hypothetical protein n=1 Tax=Sulfurovum sp. TSL6 TaxID=2826995 RepID=UPI001CC73146|nr:hypothetical protein [Sulfurovum sp. TSL6]GIU01537.1 hypothetical protein TSL6_20430 [Sulfurovum sp. TSL6]